MNTSNCSKKLFQKGVDLLEKYDAVIPGLTPTDTVKVVDKSDFISRTLDRAELVNVQTPQTLGVYCLMLQVI